jgi:ABC-2 type transport system permease protein
MLRRWPVFAQGLRDRRRSLVWWSLGVTLYIAFIAASWPSIRSAPGLADLESQMPESIMALMGASGFSFSTGAGYVSGELFGFMIPIFALILVIGTGGAAIGGAEERGLLDLLLSHPLSRSRVLLQSAALMAFEAVAFGCVIVVALLVASPISDLGIDVTNLIGAVTGIVLLSISLGSLALVIGAATGSRGLALAIAGSFAAVTYLASSLSELVSFLGTAKWLSPFWYSTSGAPLVNGYTWWHGLVLAGSTAVILALGTVLFERRDLAA